MTKPNRLSAAATAAAAACALLTVPVLAATPAAAASTLPDATHTASLTIAEEPASNTTAVTAGATYALERVEPVNLSTQAGWQDAARLSGSFDDSSNGAAEASVTRSGYTLHAEAAAVTNSAGTVAFAGLPIGLYLVEETSAPAGSTPATPFIVALPMTNPETEGDWLYDVTVHPKIGVVGVSKSVTDDAAEKTGDTVRWAVTADIPTSTVAGAPLPGYAITDRLDARLTYLSAAIRLADPVTGATTSVPPADYTLTAPNASNDRTLRIEFTPAGLVTLAAHRGQQVVVDMSTRVVGSGEIANSATLYPGSCSTAAPASHITQPGGSSGISARIRTAAFVTAAPSCAITPITSNPVETRWGGVVFIKKDAATGRSLPGARFAVYASKADAESGRNPLVVSAATQPDGTVTVDGLRVSDFSDGHDVAAGQTGYHAYWAVETQAPTGYRRQTQPIEFTILSSDAAYTAQVTVTDASAAVVHQPTPLAHTGTYVSAGVIAVALAAITAGVLVLAATRRRARARIRHE